MKVLAFLFLALNIASTLAIPSRFGKEREPWTYNGFLAACVLDVVVLAICGRVIGWW